VYQVGPAYLMCRAHWKTPGTALRPRLSGQRSDLVWHYRARRSPRMRCQMRRQSPGRLSAAAHFGNHRSLGTIVQRSRFSAIVAEDSMSAHGQQKQPPQSQNRQPGHEAEMTPKPEFQPRFRGGTGSWARWRSLPAEILASGAPSQSYVARRCGHRNRLPRRR
jgi:hypothetical protein